MSDLKTKEFKAFQQSISPYLVVSAETEVISNSNTGKAALFSFSDEQDISPHRRYVMLLVEIADDETLVVNGDGC